MDERVWIHSIHEMPENTDENRRRHLLQFTTAKQFLRGMAQIRQMLPALPLLSLLRPLPLINAFSCSLPRSDTMTSLAPYLCVEPEAQPASVHGIAGVSAKAAPAAPGAAGPWIPWGVNEIKAPAAWNRATGQAVRIAVIDTGIDYTHPDLRAAATGGINLVYRNLPPIDDNGHGTHISGTIAASSRQTGILGVAPQASIYAVKACDSHGMAYVSDIVRGIEWCVRNRMHIINMSFGMKTRSKSLEAAVRAAYRAGTIIVASSGNEGRTGAADFPARYRHTISVGATGKNKTIAPFSNRGSQVDIYAPGQKIFSTWLRGGYHEMSGTSMATSHVTGVIALILSVRPALTPRLIKEALRRTATPLANRKRSAALGEVNALEGVNSVLS